MAKAVDKNYVKKSIEKPEEVKTLIYNAIKTNMLFRSCSEEELFDLVDAFESSSFDSGAMVIKQGDDGEKFFVVESGTLDISVKMNENSTEEVTVGVPYESGAAFGELALMYGSPRAATIRAQSNCKLWFIERRDYRGITGQHKLRRSKLYVDFLSKVRIQPFCIDKTQYILTSSHICSQVHIGEKILGNVLRQADINAMALALQHDTFKRGDVIVREGEAGDVFYLIESGTVDVFKKGQGDSPVATLKKGQFFGEKALLSEDTRQATCIANSNVHCLSLMRHDFNILLGNLQDLLDESSEDKDEAKKQNSTEKIKKEEDVSSLSKFSVNDLQQMQTLGVGAFGRVKLVRVKESNEQHKNQYGKTYALKCLSKRSIVENGLQDHVLNEKSIMSELNHPFILNFFGAMQDDKNIYFVLELLLGGELFKYLRAETQFPESWSRFYAATVVLAFCQIHSRNIAYRDLKPENLVLDSRGYLHIVDFGLAKKIENGKTWTLCGTPDYLAPEVILNEGHDWAVDYWALGILVYEMTAGSPPFYADDPMEVYEKILSGHIFIPAYFTRGLADLVKKLLKTYQSKRLGKTKGGTSSVMKHKWFSGFDWDALLSKKMCPPFVPKVRGDDDASNFDDYPEDEDDEDEDYPDDVS